MPQMKLTPENTPFLLGGAGGIITSVITKKEPWATLGVVVGGIMFSIGLADFTGVFTFTQLKDLVGKASGANYAASHYSSYYPR